jgi:hypothetical protein
MCRDVTDGTLTESGQRAGRGRTGRCAGTATVTSTTSTIDDIDHRAIDVGGVP